MNIQMQFAPRTPLSRGADLRQPQDGGQPSLTRKEWVRRCAARLGELRPEHDWTLIASLAKSMWADVGSFDPVIAAELEHEAWL